MKAHIYHKKNPNPDSQTSELLIDDKGPRFLDDSILGTCAFRIVDSTKNWQLTFFKATPFEVNFSVMFDPALNSTNGCLARAIWVDPGSSNYSASIRKVSEFLRGSESLTNNHFIETTKNRHLTADSKGIGYISFDNVQFERAIICLCLAEAYYQTLQNFRHKMADEVNKENINIHTLQELYKQVLVFNAAHYSRHAVDLKTVELKIIWDHIYTAWHLQELNDELVEQLNSVAKLLQAENDRNHEQLKQEEISQQSMRKQAQDEQHQIKTMRDASFNKKMTLFGIIIALFSALSIVDVTPTKLSDFLSSWKATISESL